MTQVQMISGCIQDDRKAQQLLYEHYKQALFGVSLKYCKNFAEAEDNLHNSFLTIFSTIKSFRNQGSFEGWMKRIAINTAINHYKKELKLVVINDEFHEQINFENEDLDVSIDFLLQIIQELPTQYRLVFNLFELDEYSHQEISVLLSISENTSKSNLHRAKSILKEKLKKHQFQQFHGQYGK